MTPLVSVLMPLFNATDTLPLALASLRAQTYQNWECIAVDDGSTDDPHSVITSMNEPRIRFDCLDRNRGRGYARQRALEMARGVFVTFLDADDWIFPSKLQKQVEYLAEHPEVAVLGTGMAILRRSGELAGVRNLDFGKSLTNTVFRRPGMPPFAFPPSMMAADLAKKTGFDTTFPTAEDVDFLLRALIGKRCAVLPTPLYAYREQGAATLHKSSSALNYCCRMFVKHFDQYPKDCVLEIAKARSKQIVYHIAAALGLWEGFVARRSRPPSAAESEQYQDAWATVLEYLTESIAD